jgi:hypothetical protein
MIGHLLKEDDGSLVRFQEPSFGIGNNAKTSNRFSVRRHDRKGLVVFSLVQPQALYRSIIRCIAGDMESAEAFDRKDAAIL